MSRVELLRKLASYDDVISFARDDLTLAKKYFDNFPKDRDAVMNTYLSAASNSDWVSTLSIWTNKNNHTKRAIGTFDEEMYLREFIKARMNWLDDKEKHKEPLREGFDVGAFFFGYEKDIVSLYESSDLSLIEKACLYKVESQKEDVPLDVLRYIATYDDVITGALNSKPNDKTFEEWLPEVGNIHYTNVGKQEIIESKRPLDNLFNTDDYVASYPESIDHLKDSEGNVSSEKVCVVYITYGFVSGLSRSKIDVYELLSSHQDIIQSDVYVNNKLSKDKVIKRWIEKVKSGDVTPTKFDDKEHKIVNELSDEDNVYKHFVEQQIESWFKELKRRSSIFYKLRNLIKLPTCTRPQIRLPACGSKK